MKTLIAFVVVVLIIVGGIYISKNKSTNEVQQSVSKSVLSSNEKVYDFGEIEIFGGKVENEFVLTNEGPDPIVIIAGTTSCGCTEGEIDGISFGMHEGMSSDLTINAGETKNLKVIYDPLAHGPSATGKIDRQVFLKTNSTATPELEIRITANVVKNTN